VEIGVTKELTHGFELDTDRQLPVCYFLTVKSQVIYFELQVISI